MIVSACACSSSTKKPASSMPAPAMDYVNGHPLDRAPKGGPEDPREMPGYDLGAARERALEEQERQQREQEREEREMERQENERPPPGDCPSCR
jgi:hypothetical protein